MNKSDLTRREFIKTSSAAALGGAIATNLLFPSHTLAENSETLKIGLVGCGGRGSGAVQNAFNGDPNTVLVAMGDAYPDRAELALTNLRNAAGDRVKVTKENCYSGLDAYKKVIDSGCDIVILASPPAFRVEHIKYAVEKGKHVFCEKPVCTDAAGYRAFLEAVAKAKEKNLGIQSGFCWRSNVGERVIYDKVLNGDIGEIRSLYGTYNTSPPRQPLWEAAGHKLDPKSLEFQLRNWIHFLWSSGDHLVEQAIHVADLCSWAMGDKVPKKCTGHGGRQIPPQLGNIYDHFSIVYEWEDGIRGFVFCRQQPGCWSENMQRIYGSKGTANVTLFNSQPSNITDLHGKRIWKCEVNKRNPNMYDVEHQEFIASIRAGKPLNNGENLARSSMMGIMGRMAAYTGLEISWEDAIASQQLLVPSEFDPAKGPEITPIPIPGQTKFI